MEVKCLQEGSFFLIWQCHLSGTWLGSLALRETEWKKSGGRSGDTTSLGWPCWSNTCLCTALPLGASVSPRVDRTEGRGRRVGSEYLSLCPTASGITTSLPTWPNVYRARSPGWTLLSSPTSCRPLGVLDGHLKTLWI